MEDTQDDRPSASLQQDSKPTQSAASMNDEAPADGHSPVQRNAQGRARSDEVAIQKNFDSHQPPSSTNLSYPPANAFWQNNNSQTNAFWQRLLEEQQRQDMNIAETTIASSASLQTRQDEESKVFAQSPNPSMLPTHRQAIESKNDEKLLRLIRNGGVTQSSTKIANIRQGRNPLPSKLETAQSTERKNASAEPGSPKKGFFNKLNRGGAPAFKPSPGTCIPAVEPFKLQTPIPAKAAQLLGTNDITPRQYTPTPDNVIQKRAAQGHLAQPTPQHKIPPAIYFTPERLFGVSPSRNVLASADQGLLLQNLDETVAQGMPGYSVPRLDFYDQDIPPTPPSKDRPRKPLCINIENAKNDSTMPALGDNIKAEVSTTAQLGETSPMLGVSQQRQYPTVRETTVGLRSIYGDVQDAANLTPSPTAFNNDGAQHQDSENSASPTTTQTSLQLQVIHPSGGNGTAQGMPATFHSPSIYSERCSAVPQNDGFATPNLYPGPLHVAALTRNPVMSGVSNDRSRDFSDSTSASVPIFLDQKEAVNTEQDGKKHPGGHHHDKDTTETLKPPFKHFECEETPHRPSYESLPSQGTFRDALGEDVTREKSTNEPSGTTVPNPHGRNPTMDGSGPRSANDNIDDSAAHRSWLNNLESRLQDLSIRMYHLGIGFSGMDVRSESLGMGLETLDTHMASFDRRMAAIEKHIYMLATRSDLERINKRIDELEGKTDKSIRIGETGLKQHRSTSEYLASVKNDVYSLNCNFVKFVKTQHEAKVKEEQKARQIEKAGGESAAAASGRDLDRISGASGGSSSSGRNVEGGVGVVGVGRRAGYSTPSTANSSTGTYPPLTSQSEHSPQQQQEQQQLVQRQQSPQHSDHASSRTNSPSRTAQQPGTQSQTQVSFYSSPIGPSPPPAPTGGGAQSVDTQKTYFSNLGRDKSAPDAFAHPAYRNTQ